MSSTKCFGLSPQAHTKQSAGPFWQGCQPVFTKISQTLSHNKPEKKPDSSFNAYIHKTCITKHKMDIKTRQKHRYNVIPLLGSIFLPRNYAAVHLFLINEIDHF